MLKKTIEEIAPGETGEWIRRNDRRRVTVVEVRRDTGRLKVFDSQRKRFSWITPKSLFFTA